MTRLERLRGPLVAGLIWSAFAVASASLRDAGGAVLLMWLPCAVAVASLYATPERRWPGLLGALVVAEFATLSALGVSPVRALGFTAADAVQAAIAAGLGIRVLGGRAKSPQTFAHVIGLFATAVVACAVGALIVLPFRAEPDLAEFAWWFLASVLAVLTGTPALLYARQWLGFGDQNVRVWMKERNRGFMPVVAAMFVLALLVFGSPYAELLPLLFVAIVFAVIRYGQMAAACGVIAYAVAGSTLSLGGDSPAAFLAIEPFAAGVVLQAMMLLMLATALPIASMLMTRDRLEAQLRKQNADMRENLTVLNLAESLVGIGRWRYDLRSGEQHWSPLMLEMNGLAPGLAPDPGNVRDLLPDGGDELFGALAANRDNREPYCLEYWIRPPGASERRLKIHVTNEFDEQGERVALFAVAIDVTEQVQREEALHKARQRAIGLAAEAQKLANTDPLTGLANRRCTLDWLDRLVRASHEVDEPLSALIFDIDHFKRVNDTLGHQAGDEVLRRIADIARGQLRAEDLVGRIGGEEFVCILPGVSGTEARGLAERLCRAIADSSADNELPRTTISVGLAICRKGDTPEGLLARADMALYQAKEAGRNQVRRAA